MKKKQRGSGEETVFEINDDNQGKFVADSGKTPSEGKPKKKKKSDSQKKRDVGSEPGERDAVGLRIIGGKYRGSKLQYIGDHRVRPMKDRVREAVFNLIGPQIKGMHAVDLFGGTGALAIEAVSRGAISATIIEIHLPTASLLRQNILSLDLADICQLRKTDAFFWVKNHEEHPKEKTPWIIFCSPPYGFYIDRQDEMLEMIRQLESYAPKGSLLVVESDERFDFNLLPKQPEPNRVRSYPPAEVAIVEF